MSTGTSLSSCTRLCTLLLAAAALASLAIAPAGASAAETRLSQASFGPDGSTSTAFEHAAAVGVDQSTGATYVAEKSAGSVQKFNSAHEPEAFTGLAPNILVGKLTGFEFGGLPAVSELAVDSTSHTFYVAALSGNTVKAFQPDGEAADFTAGPGAGTNELAGTEPCGVAVDANGAIYVSFADGVHVFASTGEPLKTFAPPPFFPCNLGVDSHGAVYASPFGGGVDKFVPSEFPVTSSTTYEEPPVTVDSTTASALAVDPSSDNLLVDEGKQVAEYDSTGKRLGTFANGEKATLSASEGLAVNGASAETYVSDSEGEKHVEVFVPLPPPPPAITAAAATNLTKTTADLGAQINPGGQQLTECTFEYGTDSSYGTSVPCTPGAGEIPADTSNHAITAAISPLKEDKTYHWRIVATNAAGTTTTPDHSFIYPTTGTGTLPDNRAYEMVTPTHKNGALIGSVFGGLQPDFAEDGSRLVLSTIQCFLEGSCPANRGHTGTSYAFTRTAAGWQATSLTPSATEFATNSVWMANANHGVGEGTGLFSMPTGASGEDEFYVGDADGTFTRIGPVTAPERGALGAEGDAGLTKHATADFSHFVYTEEGSQWPSFDPTPGRTLYEYVGSSSQPALVGVNGGNTDLVSKCETKLGSQTGQVNQALSADGRIVYFTATICPEGGTGANAGSAHAIPANELWARVNGSESVQISARSAGDCTGVCLASIPGDAEFQAASADGHQVFFTDTQQLTDGASEDGHSGDSGQACVLSVGTNGCNLYMYDFDRPVGHRLLALSTGDLSGGGPRVQSVVAVPQSGGRVYFVAKGVLGTDTNVRGETAEPGAENLYVWSADEAHPQGTVTFVTALSPADSALEGSGLADVSPDGRFLLFTSRRALTSDDSRVDGGAAQVFRYDAVTGVLARVSVGRDGFNDNGNAGVGDARIVPGFALEGAAGTATRNPSMSNDGSAVFFMSPVGLTAQALNDVAIGEGAPGEVEYAQNVYEWRDGRVSLISDGHDVGVEPITACAPLRSAVCLVGASGSGHDVFFTSSDQLLPQDTDTQVDYYDARVCEPEHANPCITPTAPPPPPCAGEACHGIPPATPDQPNIATATFNGRQNEAHGSPPAKAAPCAAAVGPPSRSCSRRQNLAKALAGCRRRHRHVRAKRIACERQARRQYGAHAARRASHGLTGPVTSRRNSARYPTSGHTTRTASGDRGARP